MDRILVPRVRIAPSPEDGRVGGIASFPTTLSAYICRLDSSDCFDAAQHEISAWILERFCIEIAPGLSVQEIFDGQVLISAKFATATERGWSVRIRSGSLAADVTLISKNGSTRLYLDTSSEWLGSEQVDIFHFLSKKFVVVRDGVQLHDRPQLASLSTMPRLIEFIEGADRKLPVVVVSLDEHQRNLENAAVNPFYLSKRLVGIAHVIVVPGDETYLLSTRFGKELSAFRRAIRVYGPGFSATGAGASQTGKILAHEGKAPSEMITETERTAVRLLGKPREHVGFDQIYALDSHLRLFPASPVVDLCETTHLRQKIAELEVTLERRTAALHIAEARIAKLSKSQVHTAPEAPEHRSVGEVCEWVAKEFAGAIEIPKKAIKSAKGSTLRDLPSLKSALSLLASDYRRKRIDGGKDAVTAFDTALANLHLEEAPVPPRTLDSHKGKLVIDGPSGRLVADHTLRNKGNPHDPTKCVRIYFAWDEARKMAVVASLPTYLS